MIPPPLNDALDPNNVDVTSQSVAEDAMKQIVGKAYTGKEALDSHKEVDRIDFLEKEDPNLQKHRRIGFAADPNCSTMSKETAPSLVARLVHCVETEVKGVDLSHGQCSTMLAQTRVGQGSRGFECIWVQG
jgi:hypothetical protein